MITVELKGAEFFAYHGFYHEEQVLGNRFLIDLSVSFAAGGEIREDQIDNTVNYEQLYHILYEEMQQTKRLLETLAQAIIDRIKRDHPFITAAHIQIKKKNPPLKGVVDYSGVSIFYTADEIQ